MSRLNTHNRKESVARTYQRATGEAPLSVSFLAAGEYNENWLITRSRYPNHVLRINHGSQLGLGDRQIAYEYCVLQTVAPSGVTPAPVTTGVDEQLGQFLIMTFMPGEPLNYATHGIAAADTFAAVHSTFPADTIIRQRTPLADIAAESYALISRHTVADRRKEASLLLQHHDEILRLAETCDPLFAAEQQVVVNSEVNSGNFCVEGDSIHLVDWEKAVVSSRWQDTAHFLSPTTTLWRTDFRFDKEGRSSFIKRYLNAGFIPYTHEDALHRTELMMRAVLLRGLSWSLMAWHEYTAAERMLRNETTLTKIRTYLDNTEWFLALKD